MSFYVYIVATRRNGALYIDVARDLAHRGSERRERMQSGFGAGEPLRVVYYEEYPTLLGALTREKLIRGTSREWKIARIERVNPDWGDLAAAPPESMPENMSRDLAADMAADRSAAAFAVATFPPGPL